MADRVFIREIPTSDPRLGRRVHHDSRSRRFTYPTDGLSLVSAKHARRIDTLAQGNLGDCTGVAGIGCCGTNPYYDSLTIWPTESGWPYTLDDSGCVHLYSDATKIDEWPGEYPPTDTGSSGLAIAKVLTGVGMIAGYEWTFSGDAALKALGERPTLNGTEWTSDMFTTDPDGRVRITGSVEGGHEWVADEIDVENEVVWGTNPWPGFGVVRDGRPNRFKLTFPDYMTLLARQGDVVIFTPLTEPAPVPPPDPDRTLAEVFRHNNWVNKRHCCGNDVVAKAAKVWLAAKGL